MLEAIDFNLLKSLWNTKRECAQVTQLPKWQRWDEVVGLLTPLQCSFHNSAG